MQYSSGLHIKAIDARLQGFYKLRVLGRLFRCRVGPIRFRVCRVRFYRDVSKIRSLGAGSRIKLPRRAQGFVKQIRDL